jgi:cytochrome c
MHTRSIYSSLLALQLSCGAEQTAPIVDSPFRKVTLDDAPGEPMGLALLPDGRILHTTRDGEVWLHADGEKTLAARFAVYGHDEEGLQGIAIDPAFAQNGWVYLYYSPALETPVDDPATAAAEGEVPFVGSAAQRASFAGYLRLSRLRLEGSELSPSSEQILLEVPADRGVCCHLAGQIDFDAAGNLYLSTGDDTNPFQSDGFAPIDERPEWHPAFDAQRTSANTNDLRGKLLRIRVLDDGTIAIPEGNLFAPGTPATRPEIYAMGLRNPFRFAVDRQSSRVLLADYAPDAAVPVAFRGPPATGKWLSLSAPGNYGWPYCADAGAPYVDFDFATSTSGSAFDCAAPQNESPLNTGALALPAVSTAALTYSYGPSERWPELGSGGVAPMAGPAYAYDPSLGSAVQWPERLSGVPLFYDWARDLVAALHPGESGEIERIEVLTHSFEVDNPIDMEFGPDGALYVLEYGDGQRTANPDAQLSRIEYIAGAQ